MAITVFDAVGTWPGSTISVWLAGAGFVTDVPQPRSANPLTATSVIACRRANIPVFYGGAYTLFRAEPIFLLDVLPVKSH